MVHVPRHFALVALPHGDVGILHSGRMGAELKARFLAGGLAQGDALDVVVDEVNVALSRVVLRDASMANEEVQAPPDELTDDSEPDVA